MYNASSQTPKFSNTLIICANTLTNDYKPVAVLEKFATGWTELQSGLDFAGLGIVQLRASTGVSTYFIAWLPVSDDLLSVQINLSGAIKDPFQDYYNKSLTELFRRAFNRMIADAGIPIGACCTATISPM